MAKKFVHLHLHTEYSLLDGMSKINKLMDHVVEHKMDTVALTDHGAMYGAVEFFKTAKKKKVKPLIGMEAYTTNIDHTKRGVDRKKFKNFHLLLLAKNEEGYKNLMKLTSIAHLEGYYYRPRVDHKTLKKYSKGLVCTSACIAGELAQALVEDDYEKAKKVAQWHLDIFGEDYYLELQRHGFGEHAKSAKEQEIKDDLLNQETSAKKTEEGVLKLSSELGIPIVATNDAHYIKKEDARAQDALVCIATGQNVSDVKRLRYIDVPDFYVKSPAEMVDLYADHPEAISNTLKIADKCNLEIGLGKYHFPIITLPKGKTAKQAITAEANKGLKRLFKKVTPEIQDRLDYELKVINDKDYAAYFLIFQDMANWAHKRLIPINIRGSVAGSLVSYCLGITTVDPMHFNLPFERFLNPYRPSAPDIDMDIADDKRGEMIRYLTKKYGKDKVAQICTFGRMLPKAAVRDVARVLGYPYATGDKISKAIPLGQQGFPMSFERALEESEDLKNMYAVETDVKTIVNLAKQIEGNIRHISVHAGGVVISPDELTELVPLQLDPSAEKKVITQYDMYASEDVGLVKLDILGIRNLSILRESVERVKETTGKTVNLREIPLDDKKVFEMLTRGETMGVFQLSGSGMTRYIVKLEPEKIEDIMMMIALFRPGPMANIDEYINRKKGINKVEYYHPKMESFLDKSLGVLVYQDDLLYTALEIAGYNWEEVDKFRKAVGKKIPAEMARQHKIFVKGCIDNSGMTKKEAEGLWKLFEPFQGYGFNKAHSASYGMVAYQTGYMKANYPVEFMAALLTAEARDTDKIASAIVESKRMEIKVLTPDINESEVGFKVVKDKESLNGKAIRFGLSAIKNVGIAAIEAILEAREEGKFDSFSDFFARVDQRKVNKKVVESLIKVGALEGFGARAALLDTFEEVRAKVKPVHTAQQGLFGAQEEKEAVAQVISNVQEFSEDELQTFERDLLGLTLSGEGTSDVLTDLRPFATHKIDEVLEGEFTPEIVKIAVRVGKIRKVTTRRTNAEMAFTSVSDETGELDLVVFPKIYDENKELLIEGNGILVTGKLDKRDDSTSILVDKIDTPQSAATKEGNLRVAIPDKTDVETLKKLKTLLKDSPGNQNVTIAFEKGQDEFDLPFSINWDDKLAKEISNLLN